MFTHILATLRATLVLLGVQVPLERVVHLEALHRHGLAGEHALVHL